MDFMIAQYAKTPNSCQVVIIIMIIVVIISNEIIEQL